MPRQKATANRQSTTTERRGGSPVIGYSFVHTAVDDHSRLAYSEVLTDERKETAASFRQRANTFFAGHGITVERVLTDDGSCYRSRLFAQTLSASGITHKRTRPYRPQTNGKVERLNRTLLDEWAYVRRYSSNAERTEALADFLHTYNYHRCHTALGGQPPISRVNNAAGQYTWSGPCSQSDATDLEKFTDSDEAFGTTDVLTRAKATGRSGVPNPQGVPTK